MHKKWISYSLVTGLNLKTDKEIINSYSRKIEKLYTYVKETVTMIFNVNINHVALATDCGP